MEINSVMAETIENQFLKQHFYKQIPIFHKLLSKYESVKMY